MYITSFFRRADFKSRYIEVQLSLHITDQPIIQLGDKYILNIKELREIESYRHYIFGKFLELGITKVSNVVFSYSEITRKDYLSNKNRLD